MSAGPFLRRVRAAAACALLAAVTAPPAPAQTLFWNDISGPPGFERLYELDDGTLFAVDGILLYRSFSGGLAWETFPRPGGPILEFAARGTTVVLAVQVNAEFFKQYFQSTDRGDTWTRIWAEGNPVRVNLMLSADGTPHALASAGSKMAVERLVGGSWVQLGAPSAVQNNRPPAAPAYTVSAIDASGGVYIGTTADGIHSTRDGGTTWTRALPFRMISTIALGPDGRAAVSSVPGGRTAGGVFVSTDRGAGWSVAGLTDVFARGTGYTAGGDLLLLGSRDPSGPATVYRLDRGAADWDSLPPFDFAYSALHLMGNGHALATGPGLGLLTSLDGEAPWISDGVRAREIYCLAATPGGVILAGTLGTGLFRTTDHGFRWTPVEGDSLPGSFYTLAASGSRVYAGTERGLFASDDGGRTWFRPGGGMPPPSAPLPVYTVAEHAAGGLLIGTAAGVFRSTDGGASWSPSGLEQTFVRSIAPAADGSLWAATGAHGVYRSDDGGVSWYPRGLARPDLQTVAVSGSGRVFAGAASGVFISSDGGSTWSRRIFTAGHVHAILFNGNFNAYAATSAGLFVTFDAGQSWSRAGLDGSFVASLVFDRFRALVAGLYREGVSRTTNFITSAHDPAGRPTEAFLLANYPNPFNPATTIVFALPEASEVTLTVYDLLGRAVATPVNGRLPAGTHRVAWDGTGLPSGAYVAALATGLDPSPRSPGANRRLHRMMLLR